MDGTENDLLFQDDESVTVSDSEDDNKYTADMKIKQEQYDFVW